MLPCVALVYDQFIRCNVGSNSESRAEDLDTTCVRIWVLRIHKQLGAIVTFCLYRNEEY